MNISALFKVLALVSADKDQHGELTGVPVQFSPDAVMHSEASHRIDLNNRGSHVDNVDTLNGSNSFNSSAVFHSTDYSARENELDPHDNEITALELWHDPNVVVFKPYFAHEPYSDKIHTSPRAALENVVKRCLNRFNEQNSFMSTQLNSIIHFVVFQNGRANVREASYCLCENWSIQRLQLPEVCNE